MILFQNVAQAGQTCRLDAEPQFMLSEPIASTHPPVLRAIGSIMSSSAGRPCARYHHQSKTSSKNLVRRRRRLTDDSETAAHRQRTRLAMLGVVGGVHALAEEVRLRILLSCGRRGVPAGFRGQNRHDGRLLLNNPERLLKDLVPSMAPRELRATRLAPAGSSRTAQASLPIASAR